MRKRINGVWRLTRFGEYVSFVIITTLLGAAAGRGSFGWPLAAVLAANWLAVGFAFMINDVEDAPDDALTPDKARRNPISAGDLSPRLGRILSGLVALLAALLYASLGPGPFIAGLASLVVAYLYSWRPVRLKAVPIADLVSHAVMLAGLQFMAAYLAFIGDPTRRWIFPLSLVLAISLYGELFNELRDFEVDRMAGVTHTASLIGARAARRLMMAWLAIGILSAILTFIVVRLVPVWVLFLAVGLAGLLIWQRLSRPGAGPASLSLHLSFQKPFEIGAAIALLAWFAIPAVYSL